MLALTTFEGNHQAAEVLEAGACGYLLKSVGSAELVQAIRKLAHDRVQSEPAWGRRQDHHELGKGFV